MKFSWSKEKLGDVALVICKYNLWLIIQKECFRWWDENPDWLDTYGGKSIYPKWLLPLVNYYKKKRRNLNPLNFGILANAIVKCVENHPLETPFKHVTEEILQEVFYRYKDGETEKR